MKKSYVPTTILVLIIVISEVNGFTIIWPSSTISFETQSLVARKSTKLHQKWGPRWNPRPDSEYYRGDSDTDDLFGGFIHSGSWARKKRSSFVAKFHKNGKLTLQRLLVVVNCFCFICQIKSAVTYLPVLNSALKSTNFPYGNLEQMDIIEQYLLGTAPVIIEAKSRPFPFLEGIPTPSSLRNRSYYQALTLSSSLGPFTMDFVNQRLLTRFQPHRYLTSGFLHGSLLHLIFNMNYLWKMPRWLEDNGGSGNGVGGWLLYLITYLSSIVVGNLFCDYVSSGADASNLVLGASGGICGLNGLMFAMLRRMSNRRESTTVMKNMAFLLLFGHLADGISNASHIGGFLCGAIIGCLFGPTYTSGQSKWRLSMNENDPSLEYRRVMGIGMNVEKAVIPIKYGLGALGLSFLLVPELSQTFRCILKGFRSPGALSGMLMQC